MLDQVSVTAHPVGHASLWQFEEEYFMNRFEYKIHHLVLETTKSNDEQLLEALNHFGQDGWRLNRLYGEVSLRALVSWRGCLNMLLEREIVE